MGTGKSLANKLVEIVAYSEKHISWHQKRGREYIKFGKEIFSISVLLSIQSLKRKKTIKIDSLKKIKNLKK